MLQIDHLYEFFCNTLFKHVHMVTLPNGVFPSDNVDEHQLSVFNDDRSVYKFFFHDQEPFIQNLSTSLLDSLVHGNINPRYYDGAFSYLKNFVIENNIVPIEILSNPTLLESECQRLFRNQQLVFKMCLIVSEYSSMISHLANIKQIHTLYYFFHGFAALDWYRGFYALNHNKQTVKEYTYDYVSFNRLVSNDRSYRCYFVSLLAEQSLLEHGQVSFGLATEQASWQEEILDPNTKLSTNAIIHIQTHLPIEPLVIDSEHVLGSASADIPRCVNDSFWHIVTETVFYYDKLHLTEKIFKPIVMKQPFMLLGAPGNLAYLKSYGFKTFEGIIDESYDTIEDNDQRTEAVVGQLTWYCALTAEEKRQVIEAIAPIVEYNFHHFYGEFKHIITKELLDNTKNLFKEIGYNDSTVAYDNIYKVLTN
jgi:hypothetical protein